MNKKTTYTRGALLLFSLSLSACSSTQLFTKDPLQAWNRGVYQFNRNIDNVLVKPLAKAYQHMPTPIRQTARNVVSNLDDISVTANDLLQGKFKQAGQDAGRFLLNTSVGFFGVMDVATPYGLPKHHEDFGQTLGVWGVPSGPYLILPFLGPSNLRDGLALIVDTQLDPVWQYSEGQHKPGAYYGKQGISLLETRVRLLDTEKILDAAATDEYDFVRNAYSQRREALVHDGEVESSVADDELFDDL